MDGFRAELGRGGLELLEVRFYRSGSRSTLTFIVDKPGGVTLDDCAEANRRLGDYLERESGEDTGFLRGSYFLEVNSPGLDRPLKERADFERVKGEPVRVAWKAESGAGLVTTGRLTAVDGEALELEDKQGKTTRIALAAVTKASREIRI